MLKVVIIGDVVGKGGRRAVEALLPELRREYGAAFAIVNGENIAGGAGITAKCAASLMRSGADVVTLGDHVWDQRTFRTEIQGLKNVLRPANLPPGQPGHGFGPARETGKPFHQSRGGWPVEPGRRLPDLIDRDRQTITQPGHVDRSLLQHLQVGSERATVCVPGLHRPMIAIL